MAEYCEPCQPSSDGDNVNPAQVTNPNTPAGGVNNDIPPPISPTASGPVDPGLNIDQSPPNYAGGFPQQDLNDFAYLCNQLPTISMMQGLILSVLANHFADARNIINPALRQYTWNSDLAQTKIVIGVEEDWDSQIAERRPAIYLSRKSMQITKVSINDAEHGVRLDGKQYFDVLIQGSHELHCRGKGSRTPDDLAFEAAMVVARSAPILRTWLKLMQLRVTDISEKVREDHDPQDAYTVTISVPWAFWYRWVITPGAPILEFIDMQFFQ